jgi:thioesterase domain-containing protein
MGVNASDVPDQTIEEMAGRYVRELLAEHEGPFLLGGYSGGGSVTLEMVRQLQAVGEHVDNVLLFDSVPTFAPDEMPSRLRRARNLVENLRKDGLAAVAPRYSADKITRYLSRKLPFLPVQSASVPNTAVADWALGWDYVDGYVDLYDHFTAVARRYEVGTYDVDVTIFKAAQIAPILPHDYFWGEHLRGAIAMRRVPGTHQTMFYPEFSRALAQQIREALDEVESRTGS